MRGTFKINFKMLTSLALIFIFFYGCGKTGDEQIRVREKFNSGWKFSKGDIENAQEVDFVDSELEISLIFPTTGPSKDLFLRRSIFKGDFYLIRVSAGTENPLYLMSAGKNVLLEFDGVMMNAKVWVNGIHAGGWGFGYTSFAIDITKHLRPNEENVIAVRVENVDYSSRWYPGSGIYRNVWLTITNPVHVAHWGTFVTTLEVTDENSIVNVETIIINQSEISEEIVLETSIVDQEGQLVSSSTLRGKIGQNVSINFDSELEVQNPHRWDIKDPYLYTAVSRIMKNGQMIDEYETPFGIRTFRFDADKGFFLNGRSLKIKGVNMHHDLGPLGAAVSYRATERQLEIMKKMGVNAIRTAHNPPSPEQLELCDKMGIMVMDESFDEWREPKWNVKNSYNIFFDEWAEKDMRALVRRDRNHPSVILWSTGNEVPELGN